MLLREFILQLLEPAHKISAFNGCHSAKTDYQSR